MRIVVLLLVAGCGGKAFVDGGTGGASGAGGQTTNATSVNQVAASATTTSGMGSFCERACAAIQSCLSIGDCVAHCEQSPDACLLVQNEFLSCIVEQTTPGRCDMPPGCVDALVDYQSCRGLLYQGACGADGMGNCTCEMFDAQTGSEIDLGCQPEGQGSQCRCSFNGEPIGSCSSPNIPACNPVGDCCGTIYNVPGYP